MTLIDHAEEIWGMLKEGKTQQQVADEIGWNRNKVKHYAALETLLPNVWGVIVPHIQKIGTTQVVDNGTRDVPNGTISEGLLRNILDLNEQHQLEMQNQCAEIKIRAERRAGEIIPEQAKHEGGRPVKNRSHDVTSFKEPPKALRLRHIKIAILPLARDSFYPGRDF